MIKFVAKNDRIMKHDVFISYSSKNKKVADAMCHVLEEHGIKCWIAPRDIPGGADYGDLIDDAIQNCRIFIIIFSKPASLSHFVSAELNLAFSGGKHIIPYRIDETQLKGSMRLYLNQMHWIDAFPDAEARFKDLVKVISNSLGINPNPIPTPESSPIPPRPIPPKPIWQRYRIPLIIAGVLCIIAVFTMLFPERLTPEEQFEKGWLYYKDRNYTEAVKWFSKAAEQGDVNAQGMLGDCYNLGEGVSIDYQKAVKWWRKAAEQGDTDAQYSLGESYEYGEGVMKDYEEAVKWYLKAAKQGDEDAQQKLKELGETW